VERSPRYLRLLLLLLISAAFFEGYDSSILALLLPNIQNNLPRERGGARHHPHPHRARAVRRLLRHATVRPASDVVRSCSGRSSATPVFTALTALSWDIWSFAFFQFGSRIFLGAEYAVGINDDRGGIPGHRRGRALGALLTFNALGTIAVGVLLGAGVQDGPLECAPSTLVGLLPLVALSFFRRRLLETRRFEAEAARRRAARRPRACHSSSRGSPIRPHLVLVACPTLLRSIPLSAARPGGLYAERERGFTAARWPSTSSSPTASAPSATTCAGGSWSESGRARRRSSTSRADRLFMILFQVSDKGVSFVALMLAGSSGSASAGDDAFATELFPTPLRAGAAWVRNWFEIAGYVFGPALVGILGDHAPAPSATSATR